MASVSSATLIEDTILIDILPRRFCVMHNIVEFRYCACKLVRRFYLHSLLNERNLKDFHRTGTIVGVLVQHSTNQVKGRQGTVIFGYRVDSSAGTTHLRNSCLSCVLK